MTVCIYAKQDNESSTIYLGWIALFAVGVFLIYIACAGIHAARRVRSQHGYLDNRCGR